MFDQAHGLISVTRGGDSSCLLATGGSGFGWDVLGTWNQEVLDFAVVHQRIFVVGAQGLFSQSGRPQGWKVAPVDSHLTYLCVHFRGNRGVVIGTDENSKQARIFWSDNLGRDWNSADLEHWDSYFAIALTSHSEGLIAATSGLDTFTLPSNT
jgi:hypothetical protein